MAKAVADGQRIPLSAGSKRGREFMELGRSKWCNDVLDGARAKALNFEPYWFVPPTPEAA
jgi:hypothetical protein